MQATTQQLESARRKAQDITRRTIGQKWGVRTEPNVVVRGVIVEAEVKEVYQSGLQLKALYRIVMECGEAKVRREFSVSALPVPR